MVIARYRGRHREARVVHAHDGGRQRPSGLAAVHPAGAGAGFPPARAAGGLTLDTRLESDLGLDSLGRSELLARVERALGVALPDEAMLAATGRDLLTLAPAARPGGLPTGTRTPVPAPAAVTPAGVAVGHPSEPLSEQGAPGSAATLLEVLDWHLERHPERVHILLYGADDQTAPITYQTLAAGAARVASRLRREGLASGESVALMLPTGEEYFFSFFGILAAGGIPVPIYPPARPQQIEDHLRRHARILNNAGTAYLITVPQARTVARLLRLQVSSLRALLTLEGLEDEPALTGTRPSPGPGYRLPPVHLRQHRGPQGGGALPCRPAGQHQGHGSGHRGASR